MINKVEKLLIKPLWQNPDERESVARKQTATLVATQTAKFDPEDQILRNW